VRPVSAAIRRRIRPYVGCVEICATFDLHCPPCFSRRGSLRALRIHGDFDDTFASGGGGGSGFVHRLRHKLRAG
jgi:hypothetical protein